MPQTTGGHLLTEGTQETGTSADACLLSDPHISVIAQYERVAQQHVLHQCTLPVCLTSAQLVIAMQ